MTVPYIDKVFRERLDQGAKPVNAGELNYCLTRMLLAGANEGTMLVRCIEYLGENPRYSHFNEVIGAVTCCFHEWARRHHEQHTREIEEKRDLVLTALWSLVDAYEDKKRAQNGDVQ